MAESTNPANILDQETARLYLESRRWPLGVCCPDCKSGQRITNRKDGYYRCNACGDLDFTVRTATILERSHVPLHKWLQAIGLAAAPDGIGSADLAAAIGVTQKTAGLMLKRIEEVSEPSDVDAVLAYRPKPKSKARKKRARRRKRKVALAVLV